MVIRHTIGRVFAPGGLALAVTFGWATTTACGFPPLFYSAKEIRATLVDEATGHPLHGVVVVAIWELRTISGRGPRLQISEAVTDEQGQFFIPGWGPKLRLPLTEFAEKSPLLLFFKHGYLPLTLHNESKQTVAELYPMYRTMPTKQLRELTAWYQGSPEDTVQESMWDGLTIQLEPFPGTPEEWFRHLDFIADSIAWEDAKYTRRLYQNLKAERHYFQANPLNPALVSKTVFESLFGDIEGRLKVED